MCVHADRVWETVWQEHAVPLRKGKEHSQQAERQKDILYTTTHAHRQIGTLASMVIEGKPRAWLQWSNPHLPHDSALHCTMRPHHWPHLIQKQSQDAICPVINITCWEMGCFFRHCVVLFSNFVFYETVVHKKMCTLSVWHCCCLLLIGCFAQPMPRHLSCPPIISDNKINTSGKSNERNKVLCVT